MQQHIHTIVKHFFQKDSLQEVPETVLEKFAEEHPYSSVGQWLLARKIHDSAKDRYPAQAASAVTWFNNPLWLEWTLGDHEQVKKALIVPPATVKETTVATDTTSSVPALETDKPEIEEAHLASVTTTDITASAPDVFFTEDITAPIASTPEATAVETPVAEPALVIAPAFAEIHIAADADEDEETEIMIPGVSEPVSLIEPPVVTAAPIIDEPDTEEPSFVIEQVSMEETVMEEEKEGGAPPPPAGYETAFTVVADNEVTGNGVPEISTVTPAISAREVAADQNKNLSEAEEPVFEPYHTIDYFASLGIKLTQEDMRDKLGMQLKSFTEWLRSMKRIAPIVPEATSPAAIDETLQQSIQEIAGHSNEAKEVITEAMADVWAKQGHRAKAIAIYQKLSLLNPAKSAYFAARIDQLKA